MNKRISEEDADFKAVREEWAKRAKACHTTEDLKAFVDELLSNTYDYGAIMHACFAAALAGYYVMEHSPQGGITGFQAGCLMWLFIRQFGSHGEDAILHLRDWSNALYPQYAHEFAHVMPRDTWERLRGLAMAKLADADDSFMHPSVREHLKSIVDGKVPFGMGLVGGSALSATPRTGSGEGGHG